MDERKIKINDTLLRRYIRLPGSIDETFLMIDMTRDASCTTTSYANCEVWSHQDRLGSVVATTDSTGAVIDKYRYSPYGKSGHEGVSGFPFRYTGQRLDPETGLYYYKARYYDPETGRFLQTDPIGYEDQMNMYAYVGNDPMNLVDPTGEEIGDRFETPEEAGVDAVESINDQSIEENAEYGGTIEREVSAVVNEDGSTSEEVKYYASDPAKGDEDSFTTEGRASTTVGRYHTHGDYSRTTRTGRKVRTTEERDGFNSDKFNSSDRQIRNGLARATSKARSERDEKFTDVLGTPSGEIIVVEVD